MRHISLTLEKLCENQVKIQGKMKVKYFVYSKLLNMYLNSGSSIVTIS